MTCGRLAYAACVRVRPESAPGRLPQLLLGPAGGHRRRARARSLSGCAHSTARRAPPTSRGEWRRVVTVAGSASSRRTGGGRQWMNRLWWPASPRMLLPRMLLPRMVVLRRWPVPLMCSCVRCGPGWFVTPAPPVSTSIACTPRSTRRPPRWRRPRCVASSGSSSSVPCVSSSGCDPACLEHREFAARTRHLERPGRAVGRGREEFTGWFRGVRVGDPVWG
jgi:hypothetical protein